MLPQAHTVSITLSTSWCKGPEVEIMVGAAESFVFGIVANPFHTKSDFTLVAYNIPADTWE